MLEPLSKSAGYACRSVRLPQKEALSRERMLDALDTYFEARGEAGLDPFCAELFWPGNSHSMSGTYGEEVRKAPEEAESQAKRGRTTKGGLSWSLSLDEKRCAALARIPGVLAETEEGDAGLAYTLDLDEGSLSFFGDRTWEILCRFACLSLTLRQGEKTIFSNQYLLSRVTRTEKGYELQVNPVALAALGVPANEVLADWVALWKKLGERPLPGVLTLMTMLYSSLFDWDGADDEPELAEDEIAIMLRLETQESVRALSPLYAQINTLPGWRVERFAEIAKDACFGEGEGIVRVERFGDAGWE